MVLDHAGISPNPARDRVIVKLPARRAGGAEPADGRARRGRLPAASPRSTGSRCSSSTGRAPASVRSTTRSSATTTSRAGVCGCVRRRRRRGARSGSSCTRRSPTRSNATLGPREDRDPKARLFAGQRRRRAADLDREGVQGGRRCRSGRPHDLRHRRIQLSTCAACPGRGSASSSASATSP